MFKPVAAPTIRGSAGPGVVAGVLIPGVLIYGALVAILAGSTGCLARSSDPPTDEPSAESIELSEIVVDAAPAKGDERRSRRFEAAREVLLPKAAATSYAIDRAAIEAMPRGDETPFDTLLLQAPGVSADAAASHPDFHVRNEYGNVQYRINGLIVPDGVSGLGAFFDTSFVGSLDLLTGALPAQYGLRTAGVVDITARSFAEPGGVVSLYGGSHGTVLPRAAYGGVVGDTQYFFAVSGLRSDVGIENPTPSYDPIHDRTEQGKAFGYIQETLSDSARLSVIAGASLGQFQIPDVPGLTPLGDFGNAALGPLSLNERETDRFAFDMVALQTSEGRLDTQVAVFTRYAQVHFVPDVTGDLTFQDVASDVARASILNGVQADGAYRLGDRQVLRAGLEAVAETTNDDSTLTALATDAAGAPLPDPVTFVDDRSKLGFTIGGYAQDEVKLTDRLSVTAGLRFDQLYQFVTANQVSPRLGLVYRPDDLTRLHAGYARYFTPPVQAEAGGANIALATGTTLQPEVPLAGPALPERAHYFDVGADRTVLPGLDLGIDAYYKVTTDLIDDGQFGQAQVLTQLNYAEGWSEGLEFKGRYRTGAFAAYGNLSTGRTKDTQPVSNQYVLDADEYAYISSHAIFADDVQLVTASAGVSYRLDRTLLSADLIYGSGLRAGFANLDHVPAYTRINLGLARDFVLRDGAKPLTARFDVVNLFDTVYQLRDGSGVGVFAPQYGARRGFYVGLSQKL